MFIFTYFQNTEKPHELVSCLESNTSVRNPANSRPKGTEQRYSVRIQKPAKGGCSGWNDQFPDKIAQGHIQSLDPLLFQKSFLVPGSCPR